MLRFYLVLILCFYPSVDSSPNQFDAALSPGHYGKRVTLRVIELLETKTFFTQDWGFLFHSAHALSNFGEDSKSSDIWNIQSDFNQLVWHEFQNRCSDFNVCDEISSIEDANTPYYSGLIYYVAAIQSPEAAQDLVSLFNQEQVFNSLHGHSNSNFLTQTEQLLEDEKNSHDLCLLDLVYVIDGSGSVGQANFDLGKSFFKDIHGGLEISPMATRVGVVGYSYTNYQMLGLNGCQNRTCLDTWLDDLSYQSSWTYRKGGTWGCLDL